MEAAIAAVFDQLYDPKLGIVSSLGEIGREPGAPDYIHVAARTCDTAALGGVGGRLGSAAAGATRDAAYAAAIAGALTRYAAALYARGDLPLSTFAAAGFPCVEPRAFALFSDGQYRRPGFPYVPFTAETPIRWAAAVDLATGAAVHVPASLVWHPFHHVRSAGDLPVAPPGLGGLACGDSVAAASLAGLYDVVARDAAALFWHAMTPPPQIRLDTLPPPVRAFVRRFEDAGDRVALLDATTNNRIPAIVAVLASDRDEAPAFVFAAAANLDTAIAAADALMNLAETRRLAKEAQRTRPPPSLANDWEDVIDPADHLNFAAARENAERIAFILTAEDRRHIAERESATTGSIAGDLDAAVGRVALTGVRVLSADLTIADLAGLGLAVCRVIVPGYQPLNAGHALRPLGGDRLYEVPQKLGYRGIARGSAGNTVPAPVRPGVKPAMSAPWYAVTDPRPDAAWELYHENSKRGPRDGIAAPRIAAPAPDYGGLPVLALADHAPSPAISPPAGGNRLSLQAFSGLLAAGCRRLNEADPVTAFVAIEAVETLPRGLAWYDPAGHALRLLRRDDASAQLRGALASPEILRRSAALILLAADLDSATAVAGERGYRDALIATGRRLAALEAAAATASLHVEAVGFYDREVDALFTLDGLARSVTAVVAVGA